MSTGDELDEMDEMNRFPPGVTEVLADAGWFPGRDVGAKLHNWLATLQGEGGFVASPPAIAALRDFGGLRVDQNARGITMARETFELDPTLAKGQEPLFLLYGAVVGRQLFPLGEAGGGHYFLAMSEDGRVFGVGDGIIEVGTSMVEAITNLVEGRRGSQLRG